jgi:hypothetical protein
VGGVLDFYSDLSLPIETKKDEGHWRGVLVSLEQIKTGHAGSGC